MKHIPLRCIPAALLAAALLAGCGAKTAPPASVTVKPAESIRRPTACEGNAAMFPLRMHSLVT